MSYMDIQNLYKAQEILLFKECFALEKIHGTSAHIGWNKGELHFFNGGVNRDAFLSLFDVEKLKQSLQAIGQDKIAIYGEAYGGKCQGMSHTYGKDIKFVVFEVLIDNCWLSVPQAEEIVLKLGLEFVSYRKVPTDILILDCERDSDSVQAVRNGMGSGHKREGIVLRPLIELTKNNGERIIAKHKSEAFSERLHTPKVIDLTKLEVLTKAEAIADEWCVPMRLEHVLQGLPNATGMEHTTEVIRGMISDIEKESVGEVVMSKEARTAIGKKTAAMWKKRVMSIKEVR